VNPRFCDIFGWIVTYRCGFPIPYVYFTGGLGGRAPFVNGLLKRPSTVSYWVHTNSQNLPKVENHLLACK
jgi:hypothetical protein